MRIMSLLEERASDVGPFESLPHVCHNDIFTTINILFDCGRPWEASNLLQLFARSGTFDLLAKSHV